MIFISRILASAGLLLGCAILGIFGLVHYFSGIPLAWGLGKDGLKLIWEKYSIPEGMNWFTTRIFYLIKGFATFCLWLFCILIGSIAVITIVGPNTAMVTGFTITEAIWKRNKKEEIHGIYR